MAGFEAMVETGRAPGEIVEECAPRRRLPQNCRVARIPLYVGLPPLGRHLRDSASAFEQEREEICRCGDVARQAAADADDGDRRRGLGASQPHDGRAGSVWLAFPKTRGMPNILAQRRCSP